MLVHTEKPVRLSLEKKISRLAYGQSPSRGIAFGCCALSLLFCLTVPAVIQKNVKSTDQQLHPGKVLRTAIPDESRSGEDLTSGFSPVPVVHAIWHEHHGESVSGSRVMPIPSVLYVRPATDRAPPVS